MDLKSFMKENKPGRQTKEEIFLNDIKGQLEKDIDTLIKEGYTTSKISEYLKLNKVETSKLVLNNYLSSQSKKLGINRQPKQLQK